MREKFTAYLDQTFNHVPYSKAALELREEILSNLLERAEELKADGVPIDEIFSICIDGLGDYTEAINALKRKPVDFVKDTKMWASILFVISFVLTSVLVYVVLGFTLKLWGKGALIIFPSMLGTLFVVWSIMRLIRNVKLGKHAVSGVVLAFNVILYITALFFILWGALGVKAKYAWTVFTYIPLGVLVVHVLTQKYLRRRRVYLIVWMAMVLFICLPIFLTVSTFTGLWHPLWLIMVGGVICDIFILGIMLTVMSWRILKTSK